MSRHKVTRAYSSKQDHVYIDDVDGISADHRVTTRQGAIAQYLISDTCASLTQGVIQIIMSYYDPTELLPWIVHLVFNLGTRSQILILDREHLCTAAWERLEQLRLQNQNHEMGIEDEDGDEYEDEDNRDICLLQTCVRTHAPTQWLTRFLTFWDRHIANVDSHSDCSRWATVTHGGKMWMSQDDIKYVRRNSTKTRHWS